MKAVTMTLAVAAVVTAIPAWLLPEPSAPQAPVSADRYFGVEIDGAVASLSEQVGSLRVVMWQDEEPQTLRVAQGDGAWRITSRHDYPSDAERRVGEAASAVLGVAKLRPVSSDVGRHAELGVLDPLADDALDGSGRGQRVTLEDRTGAALVDLIIGEEVVELPGQRYVREADGVEVYTAAIDTAVLTTRFIDWVQPNPFAVAMTDVRALLVQDYSIDETTGTVQPRSTTRFTRPDDTADWSSDQVVAGEQVADGAVDTIVQRFANLRLADVNKRLGLGQLELQGAGIFFGNDGNVYANEGALTINCGNGLIYTLFFGEVAASVSDDGAGAESDRLVAVAVGYDQQADDELPPSPADDADEAARQAAQQAIADHV
ncbi:MAG: DUF4340 domain-containing protein, partial [Planctomycetota bacterium]